MAYKDEYEVARLYTNGDFQRKLSSFRRRPNKTKVSPGAASPCRRNEVSFRKWHLGDGLRLYVDLGSSQIFTRNSIGYFQLYSWASNGTSMGQKIIFLLLKSIAYQQSHLIILMKFAHFMALPTTDSQLQSTLRKQPITACTKSGVHRNNPIGCWSLPWAWFTHNI